jgi:HSP20 family protein
MGILKRNENENNRQRRDDQNALVRSDQQQIARDPFQVMARDPFQLMREMVIDPFRVFQQMAPWSGFGREGRDMVWNPSFEVRETDDAFLFKGDIPGIRQEDLDISLIGNNLQISGKREREEENDEGTLHTYERSYGQFSRSFTLPETADLDNVRCDLKDGVLTLAVPKKPGSAPHRRKIQIGSGSKA